MLRLALPIGMPLERSGCSDLQWSAPPFEHERRAHFDAHAVAARLDDEVTPQIGGESAAGSVPRSSTDACPRSDSVRCALRCRILVWPRG